MVLFVGWRLLFYFFCFFFVWSRPLSSASGWVWTARVRQHSQNGLAEPLSFRLILRDERVGKKHVCHSHPLLLALRMKSFGLLLQTPPPTTHMFRLRKISPKKTSHFMNVFDPIVFSPQLLQISCWMVYKQKYGVSRCVLKSLWFSKASAADVCLELSILQTTCWSPQTWFF